MKDGTKTYRRKKLKALRMKCDRHLKTSEELKNALENRRFRTFGTTVVVTKQSDNKTFKKVKPTCRNFHYAQWGFYAGRRCRCGGGGGGAVGGGLLLLLRQLVRRL